MLKARSGKEVKFEVNCEDLSHLKELKAQNKLPRIGVLVLTYNHSNHIEDTLNRVHSDLVDLLEEIFVFDDRSPDNTVEVLQNYQKNSIWANKLKIFKNSKNLRYGGNQKAGYQYAIDQGLDSVIMLHGDGQYAPEYIPSLMRAMCEKETEIVFASRMMQKTKALEGGMPLYKYIGNKVLTTFENIILGTKMFEFHSGYRMYSTKFLKRIPFHENTDDFHFDTEIIIQARHLGMPIKEIPIQAFYGDEDCNVNGFVYAADVCKAVIYYRMHQLHLIRKANYIVDRKFIHQRKKNRFSSHQIIIDQVKEVDKKVLYVGKDEDLLVDDLLKRNKEVTLLLDEPSVIEDQSELSIKNFRPAENHLGLSNEKYDLIILSDVLSKVENPKELIHRCTQLINDEGRMIVSVPNIAVWPYRLSLLFGRFNYASAGPLDKRNLRHFTSFSICRLFKSLGIEIEKIVPTTLPFEVYFRSSGKSRLIRFFESIYYLKCRIWPSFFAYQFVSVVKLKNCPKNE